MNERQRINEELKRVDAEIADIKAQIAYLERGAEPFWMQDVRLAQRRIEDRRRAIARSRPDQST